MFGKEAPRKRAAHQRRDAHERRKRSCEVGEILAKLSGRCHDSEEEPNGPKTKLGVGSCRDLNKKNEAVRGPSFERDVVVTSEENQAVQRQNVERVVWVTLHQSQWSKDRRKGSLW
jgi:hypothetical protein